MGPGLMLMGRWQGALARGVGIASVAIAVASCGGGSSGPPPCACTPDQLPVIQNFSASPSWITSGASATLKWSVTGASSLTVSGIGAVSGTSTQVTPGADATYVLTATNQFGSRQAQVTLPVYLPPTVWFAPDDSEFHGAADYLELFTPNAAWSQAAAHVRVFKLYTQMILTLSDAQLTGIFADLKRRHIAMAVEFGPLTPKGCGIGIEGFSGDAALQTAQRIQQLGGTLNYLAFDEPMTFGALYSGAQACNWTPLQVAQNAAQSVAQIRTVFPDVVVGDIEVVPHGGAIDTWLESYEQWMDAWQQVTGQPLAFFDFDVDWNADWQPAASALTRALLERHIPAGHIYNGNGQSSDADWMAAAEQHLAETETREQLLADEAIFQSWEPYPKHDLPETDPSALTYLIDRYFLARSQLTLASSASSGQGTLTANAAPLANATVTLTGAPLSGSGQSGAYTDSGTVPTGTQYLVFGARVALENCSTVALPAEFYVTDFTLDAGAAGQVQADFTNQLNGWGIWGNPSIAQVEQSSLHVQVTPGETMGLNSNSLPFVAAGAAYTFTVHAVIPLGSRGDGCVIAVFQDGSFNELGRAAMQIVPLPIAFGSLQTDSNGAFAFNLAAQPSPFVLWADYAGSSTHWPAAAAAGVGTGPALSITTTALPDATAGSAYTQTLHVSGGHAPYLWAAGPVPPGLVLHQNGTLSGIPASAGTWMISLSVVDDSAPTQLADVALQLIVH